MTARRSVHYTVRIQRLFFSAKPQRTRLFRYIQIPHIRNGLHPILEDVLRHSGSNLLFYLFCLVPFLSFLLSQNGPARAAALQQRWMEESWKDITLQHSLSGSNILIPLLANWWLSLALRAVDESSIRRSCSVLWSPLRSAQYHICSLCRERGLQPRQRPAGARRTGPEIPAPHFDKFCQSILSIFWQKFGKGSQKYCQNVWKSWSVFGCLGADVRR